MRRIGPYVGGIVLDSDYKYINISILAPEDKWEDTANYAGHTGHGTKAMRDCCWCGAYERARQKWTNQECEDFAWKRR